MAADRQAEGMERELDTEKGKGEVVEDLVQQGITR